jgi:transcriptional regulator with XRE-family HTH domain
VTDTDPDWPLYRNAVGQRLRAARLGANLTQEALAHRAGVSRNLLQRVERGDPEAPRLGSLWRLARAVDMPTGELLADPG